MFGLMGVARLAGQPGGAWSPLRLFAASEQGAWYDPSNLSTMFQLSSGTTAVTAVEQPVGYIADRSGNGNHATQATAAARPVLSARVNLMTYTEQLDNAPWLATKSGVALVPTVTANAGTAPDGTATADRLELSLNGGTASGDISSVRQIVTTPAVPHVFSVYLRSNTGANQTLQIIQPNGSGVNITVTPTWQRFETTATGSGGPVQYAVRLRGAMTPTNSDVADVLAWGAQLETGSIATTYQRVTTATDYDTVGFPQYIANDGIDDLLSTTFPNLGTDVTIARAVPMVGASILTGQTIGAGVRNDSTNHAGLVIIDRALTAGETAALTAYLDDKAGV